AHGGAGIAHFVEGGGLVLGTTGKVLLGIATIGSIADNFAQTQGSNRDPNYWWIRFEAIRDAFWVLRHYLKCAKFFGLVDKNGQFSQKKFDELRKKEKFYVDVESRQNMAHTNGNNVTFERGFFNDGWFKGSRAPYSIQNPRQGRAQTVLHEIGHSKGLLKHDNTGDAPEDPNSPANQNEKAIKDNCGKGLSQIPTSY
ncbi:MAG TPA: hypothetical protein VNS32_23600, partial [Flavisolibacter sp.]|nr:hypothetical protein [Flavisolibacter sp.]